MLTKNNCFPNAEIIESSNFYVFVELYTNTDNFFICSVYLRPSINMDMYLQMLENSFDLILSDRNNYTMVII